MNRTLVAAHTLDRGEMITGMKEKLYDPEQNLLPRRIAFFSPQYGYFLSLFSTLCGRTPSSYYRASTKATEERHERSSFPLLYSLPLVLFRWRFMKTIWMLYASARKSSSTIRGYFPMDS